VSQNILIVDSSSPSSADSQGLGRVLSELENARRITWDSFAPRQLRDAQHCLMIANALDRGDHATAFFRWLRDNPVPLPILAILPGAVLPGDDSSLLCAAIETVDDFLLSPVRPEELKQRIARFLGPRGKDLAAVQTALTAEIGLGLLVGQDPAFLRVMEQIALFGTNDAPVLLTGETGTGKELSARVTHLLSKRHAGPFIPVDCGGIPDHLFENELFGHARGAFTDARSDQKGLVALAQGGTLFLDEIDSLSLAAQSKVLRLLQEHTYRPLGSEVFKRADVRIVTATNRDLHQLVEQKLFRSDLYFRIHVLHIHLPALRDRPTDIELLTRHFIDDICAASNLPRKVLSQAAARKLRQHDWPGNVRELYNTMQRAVLCSPGAQVAAVTINLHGSSSAPLDDMCEILSEKFRSAKLRAIQCFERDYVRQMMDKHAGNVTQAAREAGKDRRAFGRLAKKYGFPGASA
jgi:DNA-binding NtrC family response regulator